ncbi:elongation factor G [Actinospica robiniae]|uniref:elongation factor G n=1 Tax=Actinospica robiniae TaxID=304901 RepID=UPI00040E876B|nr:TetM/TetW/TetO/TetS family tetracycline resistance ribosomal protection protein [Actinospica robiniae]
MSSTLNIGVLAHVDAGKTSLTERLLFQAGAIDRLGSVDGGDTQTDSLALERRRGITIKSAVVALTAADGPGPRITLVDTPGHADFIAEVERALRALDGVVLVVSAVEGVQAQTRVLMRTIARLGLPTLIFANKTDRAGAREESLLSEIREKLTDRAVALTTVEGIGTASARTSGRPLNRLGEFLADGDDAFLARYLDDAVAFTDLDYHDELARQVADARAYPVYFGSAATGAGVAELTTAIRELLPARSLRPDGPLRGTVFKIDRGRAGEKIAYARLDGGALTPYQHVSYFRRGGSGAVEERVGRITAVEGREAGQVARISGLKDVRIGDRLGNADGLALDGFFAPPSLESVVTPRDPGRAGALFSALEQLAEADPYIAVRRDDTSHAIYLRLYGEVQKEVIETTLAEEFGIEVGFSPSRTISIERVAGVGSWVQERRPDERIFDLATVGLRIEPGVPGSGLAYGLEVELGALPLSFHTAIEESVRKTLLTGPHGWEITDCRVTVTDTAQFPTSTAGHFRTMAALALTKAIAEAGTVVCEPVNRFELDFPADSASRVLARLIAARAVPDEPKAGRSIWQLTGTIPAANVAGFEQELRGLTRGEGVFLSELDSYRPC